MRHYVLSRMTPEGGYSFYRVPAWGVEEPNAPDTLAALESLRLLGVRPPEPDGTVRYLRRLQQHDGGYPSLTIGWAAISALRLLSSRPERSPDEWIARWAGAMRNAPRRGDAATSLRDGARLIEIEAARGDGPDPRTRRWAGELLDATADRAGGWARPEADLETTGLALLLAARAAWEPDAAALAQFLRRCEDSNLGLRLRPDAVTTSVGTLWGGLLLADAVHARLRYPDALARSLVLLQRRDGGLGARHLAISTLQDTWRGLQSAALLDRITKEGS